MRKIDLEIEELVGYGLAGPEGDRVRKVGSPKLGCKASGISDSPEEAAKAAERDTARA
jgi:hypothetical protein